MKMISKIYIVFMILIMAGLYSCKIGKKYSRPELHLPERITEQHSDSSTLADQDWKTIYTDTLLQSLIQKALDNNKDMLIAASRIKELAYRKRIATGDLFPTINGAILPNENIRMTEEIIPSTMIRSTERFIYHGTSIYGEICDGHVLKVLPNISHR